MHARTLAAAAARLSASFGRTQLDAETPDAGQTLSAHLGRTTKIADVLGRDRRAGDGARRVHDLALSPVFLGAALGIEEAARADGEAQVDSGLDALPANRQAELSDAALARIACRPISAAAELAAHAIRAVRSARAIARLRAGLACGGAARRLASWLDRKRCRRKLGAAPLVIIAAVLCLVVARAFRTRRRAVRRVFDRTPQILEHSRTVAVAAFINAFCRAAGGCDSEQQENRAPGHAFIKADAGAARPAGARRGLSPTRACPTFRV